MRGRTALQRAAPKITGKPCLHFAPALGVRTRPRVAFAAEQRGSTTKSAREFRAEVSDCSRQ